MDPSWLIHGMNWFQSMSKNIVLFQEGSHKTERNNFGKDHQEHLPHWNEWGRCRGFLRPLRKLLKTQQGSFQGSHGFLPLLKAGQTCLANCCVRSPFSGKGKLHRRQILKSINPNMPCFETTMFPFSLNYSRGEKRILSSEQNLHFRVVLGKIYNSTSPFLQALTSWPPSLWLYTLEWCYSFWTAYTHTHAHIHTRQGLEVQSVNVLFISGRPIASRKNMHLQRDTGFMKPHSVGLIVKPPSHRIITRKVNASPSLEPVPSSLKCD